MSFFRRIYLLTDFFPLTSFVGIHSLLKLEFHFSFLIFELSICVIPFVSNIYFCAFLTPFLDFLKSFHVCQIFFFYFLSNPVVHYSSLFTPIISVLSCPCPAGACMGQNSSCEFISLHLLRPITGLLIAALEKLLVVNSKMTLNIA